MMLETLLCILLYLGAIVSPGTYTYSQIDDQQTANQVAIDQIHADPVQEQDIVSQFTPQLELLDIYDDEIER
jgi:hypothetical protein